MLLTDKLLKICFAIALYFSLSYCFILTSEINNFGWVAFEKIYLYRFILAPIASLLIIILTKKQIIKIVKRRQTINYLHKSSIIVLIFLIVMSLSNEYALWIETRQGFVRNYCFPPYVGIIGIYITIVTYFTCNVLIARKQLFKMPYRWINLTSLFAIFGYYMVLLIHQLIEKPYFIG